MNHPIANYIYKNLIRAVWLYGLIHFMYNCYLYRGDYLDFTIRCCIAACILCGGMFSLIKAIDGISAIVLYFNKRESK